MVGRFPFARVEKIEKLISLSVVDNRLWCVGVSVCVYVCDNLSDIQKKNR